MSVTLQRNLLSDVQAKKDFLMLVSDSRKSVQGASSINCTVIKQAELMNSNMVA